MVLRDMQVSDVQINRRRDHYTGGMVFYAYRRAGRGAPAYALAVRVSREAIADMKMAGGMAAVKDFYATVANLLLEEAPRYPLKSPLEETEIRYVTADMINGRRVYRIE